MTTTNSTLFILLLCFCLGAFLHALKLYGTQTSRSPLVNWYLHEINIPFEVVDPRGSSPLNLFGLANAPVNPHPFGQVPCLDDDGLVVFESGAILMYLSDKYGPNNTPERRAQTSSWITWANSCLDPILFKENERGGVVGTGAGQENKRLRVLDTILSKQEFLLDDSFSVADVSVASYLLYIPQFFGTKVNFGEKYPHIAKYMKKCAQREAYKKAYPDEVNKVLEICDTYFTQS